MADRSENLGINLKLKIDGNFGKILKTIEDGFKKLKIGGVVADVEKLNASLTSVGKSSKSGLGATVSQIEHISEALGISTAQVKKYLEEFGNTKGLDKFYGEFNRRQREAATLNKKFDQEQRSAAASLQKQREQAVNANIRALNEQRRAALKALSDEEKALQRLLKYKTEAAIRTGIATPLTASAARAGLKVSGTSISDAEKLAKAFDLVHERVKKVGIDAGRMQKDLSKALKAAGIDITDLDRKTLKLVKSFLRDYKLRIDTKGAISALEQTAKKTQGVTFSLGNMAKRLVEFYLLRGAMFAVTNQVREAVRGVIELDQTLAEVGAISTASADQLREFERVALEIGRTSKFTAVEVAATMRILAQAGVEARDLAATTKTVEWFATGTGSGATDATKAFTTAMNVWNISAKESTRISSTLTAALNNSKLTVTDLSTSFNYLANQGAIMGMTIEETTSLIAAMANQGMKASTIGTSMSNFIGRLVAPTQRIKDMIETYGITIDQINPRLHSFAEIVGVFEEKGVSAEAIFKAFEKRVGRGFVTAILAGKAGIESMTQAITGSNADLLAYVQTMEGAGAKINVLKSELLVVVRHLSNDLAPAIKLVYEGLTDFVRGLDTTTGKVSMFIVVVTGLVAALASIGKAVSLAGGAMGLASLGPVVIGVTALLAVLAATVGYVGHKAGESKRKMDDWMKSWAEGASIIQSQSNAVNKLAGALGKAERDTDGFILVQGDLKEQLTGLAALYPELAKFLDDEKVLYSDIAGELVKVNKELREKQALQNEGAITSYNARIADNSGGEREDVAEINRLEASLAPAEAKLDKSNKDYVDNLQYHRQGNSIDPNVMAVLKQQATGGSVAMSAADFAKATRDISSMNKELVSSIKVKFADDKEVRDIKYSLDKLRESNSDLLSMQETIRQMGGVIDDKGFASMKPKDTTVESRGVLDVGNKELESELEDGKDDLNKILNKYNADRLEVEISAHKDFIRDSTNSLEARNARLVEANKAIDKKFNSDRINAVAAAQAEYLRNFKNLNTEEEINKLREGVALSTQSDSDKAKSNAGLDSKLIVAKEVKANLALIASTVSASFYDKAKLEKDKLEVIKDKPEKKEVAGYKPRFKDAEKAADVELRYATAALQARKDELWLAEDVFQIDSQILQKSIDASVHKRNAYDTDMDGLEAKFVAVGLNDTELATYMELEDKHAEITLLMQEQNRILSERSSQTVFSSFADGAREAVAAQTDLNKSSKELGGVLTNTSIDGVTDSITGMITALGNGENAWKSFRKTIGGMLQSISDEIIKYVAKLMILYAAQQLVGFAMGSTRSYGNASTGTYASQSFTGPVHTRVGVATGGFILSGTQGVRRFAEGGALPANIGVPGKDSVPAMLMPGEFVVRKAAVDHYGVDNLFKLNAMKFADGGAVPGRKAANSDAGNDGQEIVLNIINVVDPSSIPKTSEAEILNVISMDAAKNGPTTRQLRARLSGR